MAAQLVPPFTSDLELITSQDEELKYVEEPISDYLTRELHAPVLDELYDRLAWVAKKSGSHIDALHAQRLKMRDITVAEEPGLHLLWVYNTLYIKPIPPCLLNWNFWKENLLNGATAVPSAGGDYYDITTISSTCLSAIGFWRSYSFLIRHRSDYEIAKEAKLLPESVKYSKFRACIEPFRSLPDELVSKRYHYGQMRLSRLNIAVRIFRPISKRGICPWYYQKMYWQTGQFVQRLGAPALFIFAALSLILSAMQVVLAALGPQTWGPFVATSWGFSVAVIIFIPCVAASVALGIIVLLISQAHFALKMMQRENARVKAQA